MYDAKCLVWIVVQKRMDCGTKAYGLWYKVNAIAVQIPMFRNFWLQANDLLLISKRPFGCKQMRFHLQAKTSGCSRTDFS